MANIKTLEQRKLERKTRKAQRAERLEMIRHAVNQSRSVADIDDIKSDKAGPWNYPLSADSDIHQRCCPLCFQAYSDFERTAVVPCWHCREKMELREAELLGSAALPPDSLAPFEISPEKSDELEARSMLTRLEHFRSKLRERTYILESTGGDINRDSTVDGYRAVIDAIVKNKSVQWDKLEGLLSDSEARNKILDTDYKADTQSIYNYWSKELRKAKRGVADCTVSVGTEKRPNIRCKGCKKKEFLLLGDVAPESELDKYHLLLRPRVTKLITTFCEKHRGHHKRHLEQVELREVEARQIMRKRDMEEVKRRQEVIAETEKRYRIRVQAISNALSKFFGDRFTVDLDTKSICCQACEAKKNIFPVGLASKEITEQIMATFIHKHLENCHYSKKEKTCT